MFTKLRCQYLLHMSMDFGKQIRNQLCSQFFWRWDIVLWIQFVDKYGESAKISVGGVANLAKLCTHPRFSHIEKFKLAKIGKIVWKIIGKMGKIGKSGKTGKLEFYNIGQKAHFTHVITKFKTSKIPETKTTLRRGIYHALVILNNFLISKLVI